MHQNPANMVDITGAGSNLPHAGLHQSRLHIASGPKRHTLEPWKFLPNLFVTAPAMDGNLAFGLGITTPYGFGSRERDQNSTAFARPTGAWRYQAPYSTELTTINFAPSVAFKCNEYLQIGIGLDVMWSQVKLDQYYPWFLVTGSLASPDGVLKAKADGVGVSANLGVTWNVTERQTAGADVPVAHAR